VRAALEVMEHRAASLGHFISEFARLARLPEPRREPRELGEQLRRVASLDARCPVRVVGKGLVQVLADGPMLEQALVNLVRNAIDASEPRHGEVTIDWSVDGGRVVLSVIDEGSGISNPDNLFVPLFSTKPGGSGIGLVLARNRGGARRAAAARQPSARGGLRGAHHVAPGMKARREQPRPVTLLAQSANFSRLPLCHGLGDVVEIERGFSHVCVRHSTGTQTCWGDNTFGEAGAGMLNVSIPAIEPSYVPCPRPCPGSRARSRSPPGPARPLRCSAAPTTPFCWAGAETRDTLFRAVNAGGGSSQVCGITTSGSVQCWGSRTVAGGSSRFCRPSRECKARPSWPSGETSGARRCAPRSAPGLPTVVSARSAQPWLGSSECTLT
jgi:hypothetical protein